MSEVNSPEDAEVIIQKLPCDMGIHRNPRKGTLNAPEKLVETDFERPVLIDEVFPDEFDLEETQKRFYENSSDLADFKRPLISVGGDHSISFPVIKALKEENPEMKLIWLDAHLDLKEKIGGHISHDVVVRELLETGLFSTDEVFFVGTVEIDHDEKEFIEKRDINIFRPEEVGLFLEKFDSGDKCYLSVDIDVLTSEHAPGTGYPDGQLSVEDVEKVIEKVRPDYADLVEVAPPFDLNEMTVENGRKILQSIIRECRN